MLDLPLSHNLTYGIGNLPLGRVFFVEDYGVFESREGRGLIFYPSFCVIVW